MTPTCAPELGYPTHHGWPPAPWDGCWPAWTATPSTPPPAATLLYSRPTPHPPPRATRPHTGPRPPAWPWRPSPCPAAAPPTPRSTYWPPPVTTPRPSWPNDRSRQKATRPPPSPPSCRDWTSPTR